MLNGQELVKLHYSLPFTILPLTAIQYFTTAGFR